MNSGAKLQVKFWGVRGSTPTPGSGAMSYGGNTACLEIQYGNQPSIILDAGSGIRTLGLKSPPVSEQNEVHILFTHFHWDHIQGLPFFAPLYEKQNTVCFYSSREPAELKGILESQMRSPYFPVNMPDVPARYECRKIEREGLPWGDLCIKPFPLRHPGNATGYRIQSQAGSIVYASDHEHGDQNFDSILLKYSANADILIYDAQYTPEEYENRRGWGHSTWQAGTRVANEAGVRQLLLFHHDPTHEDSAIDDIVVRARGVFENTQGAREGPVYSV